MDPWGQKYRAGHCKHWISEVAPGCELYEPAGHGAGVPEPAMQYDPGGQINRVSDVPPCKQ
jgi:hypothetical protein